MAIQLARETCSPRNGMDSAAIASGAARARLDAYVATTRALAEA